VSNWCDILVPFLFLYLIHSNVQRSQWESVLITRFLVFHGGSGSSKEEIRTAVVNGVVKMNVDTDTQFAYLTGIRDFVLSKKDYLMAQVGNPDGADKPNKKNYDPRVWVREGEKTLAKRVREACVDLGNENRN